MSEPTYRINTERNDSNLNPWEGRAARITNGETIWTVYGDSEAEVLAQLASLLGKSDMAPGGVYFADEDGNLMDAVPEPQSIRA